MTNDVTDDATHLSSVDNADNRKKEDGEQGWTLPASRADSNAAQREIDSSGPRDEDRVGQQRDADDP